MTIEREQPRPAPTYDPEKPEKPQQPLRGADLGRVEEFAGRGTAVPQNVANNIQADVENELEEDTAEGTDSVEEQESSPSGGSGTRRLQDTLNADVPSEMEDSAQAGSSRAVRISQPNRKKRSA